MALTVTPSGAACGATITGVDLTQSMSDDLVAEIRANWLEHKVVAFPNQPLAPEVMDYSFFFKWMIIYLFNQFYFIDT